MPRNGKKDKPEFKTIHVNRIVEKPKWRAPRPPYGTAPVLHCNCWVKEDGRACARGCAMKEQRRECLISGKHRCIHGERCTNNVIQKRSFRPTERIECGGRGGGLVFTEDVPANTIALEYCGEVVRTSTARRRLELTAGEHTYALEITSGWVVDSRHFGSEARFINSSHEPNAVLETWWVRDTPHVVVRTLRDLRAGEEILVNYNFGLGDRAVCLCGASSCTGFIGKQAKGATVEDPVTFEDPEEEPEIQPVFSRGAKSTFKQYSLTGGKVPGDGHCLFHSAARLDASRSFRAWREAVADDMVLMCDTEELRRVYLDRANNDVRASRTKFRTFEEMIEAFRTSEWGNNDCIRHLSRLMGRGFVVFTQGSTPSYVCWTGEHPEDYHILYNSTCPSSHKLIHFDPVWIRSIPSTDFSALISELKQKRRLAEGYTHDDLVSEAGSEQEVLRSEEDGDNSERPIEYVRDANEMAEVQEGGGSSSRPRPNLSVADERLAALLSEESFLRPVAENANPSGSSTGSGATNRSRLNPNSVSFEPSTPDPRVRPPRIDGILPTPSDAPWRGLGSSSERSTSTGNTLRQKRQASRVDPSLTRRGPSAPRTSQKPFDPTRLVFRDKKQPRPEQPARAHWGLFYFVYKMQEKRRSTWDLKSLSSMALHPKISRSAAASLWEIGWQETMDDNEMPEIDIGFDHMDPENTLSLWWSSHLWASELEEGSRRDLVMAVANLGPTGIWPSIHTTLKEMADQRTGIALLGDLRISKRSIPALRSTLGFVYPQYHAIISSHSASEWEEGRRNKYHYAVCTLLHRHLYTGITTESICGKDKQDRAAVLGHALVVSAFCKPLERKVVTVNMYQHTSAFPQRQQRLYDCLERFLKKLDMDEVSLIGGGDLNAAFPGQRWDYATNQHARSDRVLEAFAEKKVVYFESPKTPTYWDPTHSARAVLDHVFSGNAQRSKLSVVPRHSWHPSHDHANVYVWADTTFLPSRPAVGSYRPPAPRIRMRSWEQKKPEWSDLSKAVLDGNSPADRLSMPPRAFETHFKTVLKEVVAAGVDLVGRATPGTNRPAFRTKEVSKLVREGRMLTAAKRETYVMKLRDARYTAAQLRAMVFLEIRPPALPIAQADLDRLREQMRKAYKDKMVELKKQTREMEQSNIKECIERVRKELGKERFTVQKALGKTGVSGTLDVLEQRVPVGLSFEMTPTQLEATLRENNLEEVVAWIQPLDSGSTEVRAPSFKLILPLLTRVPLYARPSHVLWETRTAQEDQHKLWVMDQHYQQISYAKKARCPCCNSDKPIALPLRMNGEIGTVDYCQKCFKVSEFGARSAEYEDITFLGNVVKYRTVPDGERLAGEVTFPEFLKYLRKLKEKKAAGVDRFHVEFLKHAHEDLQRFVHHLVNLYLEQHLLIDEDFLLGEIRLLFKKEPATNLRNWRPVCLLQMIYKLVALILNDRLYTMVERYHLLEGSQEGFRKMRGTGRQGQSLSWLFNRAKRNGDKLYCVYADFVSAFDSPDHPALMRALKAYGIPDVDLLASLYRASPFRVSTPFGDTCNIRVGRGCRQGCVLSPLVFDLFANLLLRHLNASGVGAQITENRTINHKAFADDVGMVVNSPIAAQNLLDRLATFCDWSGMEVNMLKTQATAIDFSTGDIPTDLTITSTSDATHLANRRSKPRSVCSLTFDGDRIDFVPPSSPFCYLGFDLTLTCEWKSEIDRIKRKTRQLCEVLEKHKYTESQGLYLFQCSAISTFRYSIGVAAWSDSDLTELGFLWVRAFKNALHLSRSVSRSLILYPLEQGGMQLLTPFTVGFKELSSHLTRCSLYSDSLALQLDGEIRDALDSTLTSDLQDLQSEVPFHPGVNIKNTILRWVHLAHINGVKVTWDRIPPRVGVISWATVLNPIRQTDVQWRQDADMLRRTARALMHGGLSNVLSLPRSGQRFRVPYGRGYTESARQRMEQWLGRIVCPRQVPSQHQVAPIHRSPVRTNLELLSVVSELLRDATPFHAESLRDYLHYLEISIEHNEGVFHSIQSAVLKQRPRSWKKLAYVIRLVLFPSPSVGVRRGQRESLDWEQIRRHAATLYSKVISIRRHNGGKGWELKCELRGRTADEAATLLALTDRQLRRALVSQRRPILLPPEWWPDETPPTVWGWWVLPATSDGEGVQVRCMERRAILEPVINLPLRGPGSIEYALQHLCLRTVPRRWIQFSDLGIPMRTLRHRETDAPFPSIVLDHLRSRGPLTPGELLPGGKPDSYRRYLRRAVLPSQRPAREMFTLNVEPDELDDDDIISDPQRLLQYHVSRFRRATRSPLLLPQGSPSVLWGTSRAAGVDVRTHSYLDGAPPRLDPNLVSVSTQSLRYHDHFSDFVAISYQGVARIEDALGGWDLDGMRLHQIKNDRAYMTSQGLREHRNDMQRAEKRGYRTMNWSILQRIAETFRLDTSMGEPLFGSYPSFSISTSLFDAERPAGTPSNWLFLDSVEPLQALAWCDRFMRGGGGVIAATSLRNMTKDVQNFLRLKACAYGSTSARNLLRVKGWWTNGDTKTAGAAKHLHLWVLSSDRHAQLLPNLLKWIDKTASSTLPSLGVGGRAWSYWSGSEAGRLGLYDGATTLLATDGSASETALGAGYTLRRGGLVKDWHSYVEGADEQITSFRPEAGAFLEGLRAAPRAEDFAGLVDNESLLTVIDSWIGNAHHPSPGSIADADLILQIIREIGLRTGCTRIFKIKSHRGEPYNTRADALADLGTGSTMHTVNRTCARRITFRVPGYSGLWSNRVSTHAESTVAKRFIPLLSKGVLDAFLSRRGMGRRHLGAWWKQRKRAPDSTVRMLVQAISDTYPTPAKLHLWGRASTPACTECGFTHGTIGHVLCHCAATKGERIEAHNKCRSLVTECIRKHTRGWKVFPETTFEDTIATIHRLTGIRIPVMSEKAFFDPKLTDDDGNSGRWRVLRWDESRYMRIDELAIHKASRTLYFNEMTRAWDSEPDFYEAKDRFKTAWYLPIIQHLTDNLSAHGWTVAQLNFTVGARATIPEAEWTAHLGKYGIRQKHQEALMSAVADSLLQSIVDVLNVFVTHRSTRQQNSSG